METVGKVTSIAGVLAIAAVLVVGVRSMPDIKRYVKIRRM
jgi:hypothetical protein